MPAPPAPRSNRSISLKRKVLALAIAQAMLGHAHAATITVDSLLDDDGNGCTLREAIANANDSALSGNGCVSGDGADTITFDPALNGGTITLGGGQLTISSAITLQGPGADELTISGNNASRILYIDDFGSTSRPVTIDGLTLANGSTDARGGAIFNRENLTLGNCTLSGNSADSGGGLSNHGTVNVTDSTLSDNSAADEAGGMFNSAISTANLSNSTLSSNSAGRDGGGLYNVGTANLTDSTLSNNSADFRDGGGLLNAGTVNVSNSTLSDNSAGSSGGGLYNRGTANLSNSMLSGNSGAQGGGLHNRGTADLNSSTLLGNTAANSGGGAYNSNAVSLTNSTLLGNSAGSSGGGLYNRGTAEVNSSTLSSNDSRDGGGIHNSALGTVNFSNSTLSGNSASSNGGGFFNTATANVTSSNLLTNTAGNVGGGLYNRGIANVTNSTLSTNSAAYEGGGFINVIGGTANVTNSTLSGNTALSGGGLYNSGAVNIANTIIANSMGQDCDSDEGPIGTHLNNLIEDGSCAAGATNLVTGDPLLGPLQDNGGPTLTHALLAGSPALNAGDAGACPATDQRGFSRIDGACDIGSFERDAGGPGLLVTTSADSEIIDGLCSLREAITTANDDTVHADCGAGFGANTIRFDPALNGGTMTLGGADLTISSALTVQGPGADQLTISGNNASRIFFINDANAARRRVTIDSLTLANGSTPGYGGAILNLENVTLSNSTLADNSAGFVGGGLSNNGGTAKLSNSTLSGNSAGTDGGGLHNNGTASVTNSTLSGNSAAGDGGGLFNFFGTASLTNATLADNSAVAGGGLYSGAFGTANLTNTLVAGSTGGDCADSNDTIATHLNNLIADGSCAAGATGLVTGDPSLGPLEDNGGPTLTHALLPGSTAINAAFDPDCTALDQRGFSRSDGACDIGALEFDAAPPPDDVFANGFE